MEGFVFSLAIALAAFVSLSSQQNYLYVDPEKAPEDVVRSSEFIRNKEHLKEHLTDFDFDPDKASPEELDFHFFKSHDYNSDNKLDGLELLQAITHAVEDQLDARPLGPGEGTQKFKENVRNHLIGIVDKILRDDDADKDGYINYAEFAHTRRASEMLQSIGASAQT